MDAHEWTPWGPRPLREREGEAAHSHELGGSGDSAFVIPFLPFPIEPLRIDRPNGSMSNRGAPECQEIEFPSSEKVLARTV